MSRPALSLVPSSNTATGSGQRSLRQGGFRQGACRHDGLSERRRLAGRPAPVRTCLVGQDLAQRLREVWPVLMLRKYVTDEANAAAFGVRRQTATYWRNGDNGPNGPAVALAWMRWPDEMRALLGGG